jgi:hypothetical protein
MLDANVRDRHLDDVEALGDPGNPCVASNRGEALDHGLVKGGRRDFDGMRDTVPVLNRHAA